MLSQAVRIEELPSHEQVCSAGACRESAPRTAYRGPVRLSFVSDIHGNIAGLADVARRVDQLVVLGDLLDYVDYYDPAGGIIGRIFGEERVRPFIALRLAGDFPGLRRATTVSCGTPRPTRWAH